MQTLSAALTAALLTIDARVAPRTLVDLYEFYPSDYVPGVSGFEPADAIESFAAEEITWDGQAYRREAVSRGDVVRNMNEKTNECTVTFSNISRYMATLATTTQIEGLFLVIRTVVPSVTDDSIVLFVGRCDKPSDIDKKQFTLSARQDFGNINQEIPPREFTAEDPNGRTPSDPLYEGFRIIATNGTFPIVVTTPSTGFFGRLFGRQNSSVQTRQWSSLDSTPYGSAVPMIFGRCQMELVPIFFADIGYHLIGVWVVGEGRVDELADTIIRDTRLTKQSEGKHYGDPGGTGTNNQNTSGPINQGYLSKTAYIVLSMYGSAGDVIDDPPLVTDIVKGIRVPLPNSSGVYGAEGWTDNPVHLARFILTDARLVKIDSGFMEDSVNYQTGLHCDEPIIDDSNGEMTLVMQADLPQAGTGIQRSRSTGIIDARYFLYHELADTSVIPEFENPDFVPFDPADIPDTFSIVRFLRKRYTANVPLTEKMRAVDFLYKVLFPCAKLFLRINKRGKYEIRSEKPSDATMIYAATVVGATSVKVRNVVPWKTGELLQGRIHIGFGLTTSEVRDVSTATFTADGNAVTLTTGVTGGGVTSVASGATLTGGSTTVQASGTVTVGGTPAPGNTITVTIDGVAITYVLTADDTTGTVAAMMASFINASPKLNGAIQAVWGSASPTIVTIKAKLGVLNLSTPLLQAHTAPIANPTATPVLGDSAGALAAGTYRVAYSDVTALGKTALSPVASRTIAASKKIDVGAIALVGTSRNWYMSDAPNSEYLKFVANTNGSAFSINALPLPGAALAPQYNTSGEEVIRIAMSFTTNSQDVYPAWPASTAVLLGAIYLPTTPNDHKYEVTTAGTTGATEPSWPLTAGGTVASGTAVFTEIGSTYLGQSGLTRANIKKDTFKFPLGSRQASVNQVKISYRDSNNDFAKTPFRVNDPVHQALVNKIYPMEVNGEAIDNFHQMYRIANWQLAKNREGDWFNTFGTGPQGLVLEEGDVICASDDSGGLVNQVTRIEELRIHPNHDVTIGQARKYSTNMFSDDVSADIIPVPTTLRYVQTVDTLSEFIDNFPIRDADGLVAGFYWAPSRDLNTEGDWRGAALYADYGDGYVKIAESDIPSTIGVATTTLGTVTNPNAFDTVNDVTFTLKYGVPAPSPQPFNTVTQADLQANPRLNLFLVGNEYLQAATVVFNGSQSYTISDFYRGRFRTGSPLLLAHGPSERVVFLDGAEQFVAIDQSRLNIPYNYKAVTVNQDVADATAVSFTWTGGTIKPPAPSEITVYRDALTDADSTRAQQIQLSIPTRPHEAGEVVRYWVDIYPWFTDANFTANATTNELTSAAHGFTADTVIALSTTGVLPAPLVKEKHYYIRDITTNTFKLAPIVGGAALDITTTGTGTHSFSRRRRHMPAVAGRFNPALFKNTSSGVTTAAGSGGWLQTITSDYPGRNNAGHQPMISFGVRALGADIVQPGFEMEFSVDTYGKFNIISAISLNHASASESITNALYQMHFELVAALPPPFSGTSRRWLLRIKESANGVSPATVFTETDYEMPDTRYRIQISGSEVRYYRNYTGPGTDPIYRSRIPAQFPMVLDAHLGTVGANASRFSNVVIGGKPESITTYPDTDQRLDFGVGPTADPHPTYRFRVFEEKLFQGFTYLSDVTDFIT